jgi:hypothetical protein
MVGGEHPAAAMVFGLCFLVNYKRHLEKLVLAARKL